MNDEFRRTYIVGPQRAKVGDSEIKLSRAMLKDIRDKVKIMDSTWSIRKMAEELQKVYPSSAIQSLDRYIRACRVHDEVFNFYMAEGISFGILDSICPLDQDTGKFLVEEMISRKLLPSHINAAKAIMKQKLAKTWDEALNKASGKDKPPPLTPDERRQKSKPTASADPKNFDDLVKDVLYSGTEWRLKVKALIDMLPMAAEGATHSFQTFTKLYMLRHSLIEQLEFVDQTVKSVLDRMMNKASVEAELEVSDVHGNGDQGDRAQGGEGEKGEVGELHDSGQVVQNPPDAEEDGLRL